MESEGIPETKRVFLNDSHYFQHECKIVQISGLDENCVIYVDETIFHPQGGGQPNDSGHLIFQGESIEVIDLVLSKEHKGIGHKVNIKQELHDRMVKSIGEKIEMRIDEDKRRLYARIHSAGHLLDMAVGRLGYKWQPGKGCHFPTGAYVEYIGGVDPKEVGQTVESLNSACKEILEGVKEEDSAQIEWIPYEKAKEIMSVPDFLPKDRPIRYIKLNNQDKGCMCGGTHVPHLKHINQINIKKINKKGKCIRVAYDVAA